MDCIFFRETIPDDDDEFLSSFQKYITAKKNDTLDSLVLSGEECEYILDKLYKEELELDLLVFSEIAVDLHPFSDEILARRCTVLVKNGYVDLSVDLLKSKQGLFPDSKLYKAVCINSYILLYEYEIARDYATSLLEYSIDDIEDKDEIISDFGVFGYMCMEMGNFKEAIFYFNSIEKFSEPSLVVLKNLALCQISLKIENEVIDSYKKHLDEDPFNYFLWYKLGVLQFSGYLYEDAIESLNNSLAITTKNLEILKFLAEVYFSLWSNSNGYSVIARYIDLEKDEEKMNNYLYDLCFTLFSQKNLYGAELVILHFTNYDKNKIRCAELSLKIVNKYRDYGDPDEEELQKLYKDLEEISNFGPEWLPKIIDYGNFSNKVLFTIYENLDN